MRPIALVIRLGVYLFFCFVAMMDVPDAIAAPQGDVA